MKASESQFLTVLHKSQQFDIPIYQRLYSWGERECRQLWDDIVRAGSDDSIKVHFVGSIVYIESDQSQVSHRVPVHVIDGQQRITTVTLLLAALAEFMGEDEPVDGFSARKLRNYYLLNPEESGDRRYKLLLTQTDRDSLLAIVDQADRPTDYSERIYANFELFKKWISENPDRMEAVCVGMEKLFVVDVALTRGQDNPQLIFESMNSTGLALSQADLIRNYILMGLEQQEQAHLYKNFWRPIEVDFGQEAYSAYFDAFMRDFLTVRTGDIPRQGEVYAAFKRWARSEAVVEAGLEAMLRDLKNLSGYYRAIALGHETDPELKAAFADLKDLKVDVVYPFLLEVYADYAAGLLSRDEMLAIVRLVESYAFRRAICSIPTNSLNKTFSTIARSIDKSDYLLSAQAALLTLPSYRRFPSDQEFSQALRTRNMYSFRRSSYWLRRLENANRKERVRVDDYTIEHILPQNPDLSPAWKAELGPDASAIQEKWLHTLGNLTLTGYNSEYSDRSFAEKRDMPGGFRDSPLRLNKGLAELDSWGEDQIQARARRLADLAVGVWARPVLPDGYTVTSVLTGASRATYTVDDHPALAAGDVRALFEAFSREVLALDLCVTREFLKVYVAFKAETNFVDVIPQKKRLVITLNMAFPDIDDPRGICRDATGLGRWGNGDVKFILESMDELPYALSLVRQSLDRQLVEASTA